MLLGWLEVAGAGGVAGQLGLLWVIGVLIEKCKGLVRRIHETTYNYALVAQRPLLPQLPVLPQLPLFRLLHLLLHLL